MRCFAEFGSSPSASVHPPHKAPSYALLPVLTLASFLKLAKSTTPGAEDPRQPLSAKEGRLGREK